MTSYSDMRIGHIYHAFNACLSTPVYLLSPDELGELIAHIESIKCVKAGTIDSTHAQPVVDAFLSFLRETLTYTHRRYSKILREQTEQEEWEREQAREAAMIEYFDNPPKKEWSEPKEPWPSQNNEE